MSLGIYKKEYKVPASVCDYEGRLSIWDTFAIFMDIAAEHADDLSIGLYDLEIRDMFWLTLRTKIRFVRKACMYEDIVITTWPEKPERLRCLRDYTLTAGEEVLAAGKTEWAIINTKTGKLVKPGDIYPEDLEILEEFVFTDKMEKLDSKFEGEVMGEYVVRSTDIDVGGHMNNAAYIRAFAGLLSVEEWKEMDVTDMEVVFKNQCFAGDTLTFKRKDEEGKMTVQAFLPDGTAALQIIIS